MHILISLYAHPDTHERFKQEINHWAYATEGLVRSGYDVPLLSEIRFYDLRIPKEHAPKLLRDLNAKFCTGEKTAGSWKASMPKPIPLLVKIARKLLGFTNTPKDQSPQQYRLSGWSRTMYLGSLKDPIKQDPVTKTYHEVL